MREITTRDVDLYLRYSPHPYNPVWLCLKLKWKIRDFLNKVERMIKQ